MDTNAGETLLTGAAGRVGTALRPALRRRGRVRLTDLRDLDQPAQAGESFLHGDLTDPGFVAEAVKGVTTIVHLAGYPGDADWPTLLAANLEATATLLGRARSEQVRTVIYASSIHAVGGYNDPAAWPVSAEVSPRPCCRYGASKVAVETMMRLYSDQVAGAHVTCLRMPLVTYRPRTDLEPRCWLAEQDLVGLYEAALDSRARFGVHVGTSICPQPRFAIDETERLLGYHPRVHSERVRRADELPHYAPDCVLWRLGSPNEIPLTTRRPTT